MPADPWIVPETPEGRETLTRLIAQYEASGQLREFGITLVHLAQLIKQIGNGRDDGSGWETISQLGLKATEALRQTDDKASLAAALRVRSHAFVAIAERKALLEEARAISKDAGDLKGEGWALFTLSSFVGGEGDTYLEEARECFEKAGYDNGVASIELRLGVHGYEPSRIIWAAQTFLEQGQLRQAEEAYLMAALFGREKLSTEEREALVLKSVAIAEGRGAFDRQAMHLGWLADMMKRAKRKDEAKKYRDMASSVLKDRPTE